MVCDVFWSTSPEFRYPAARYLPWPAPLSISSAGIMENITLQAWLESAKGSVSARLSAREQIIGGKESTVLANGHSAASCACDSLHIQISGGDFSGPVGSEEE